VTAGGESLEAAVAQALELGGTLALDDEVSFVVRTLRSERKGVATATLEGVLAELRYGVSPYHVLGRYELVAGRRDSMIEVSRHVMPPGTDTRQMLLELEAAAGALDGGTIVDFGCGSGVLGIAALRASVNTRGTLIDVDPVACDLATRNARKLGLAERVHVMCADSLEVIDDWRSVRLIVANLPFTPTAEIDALPKRFGVHAPRSAVDGGTDGLAVIRPAVRVLDERTMPGTAVLLQIGPGQAGPVSELFSPRWRPLPRAGSATNLAARVESECVVGFELAVATAAPI
jgi:release factor glutamine methyltransferase